MIFSGHPKLVSERTRGHGAQARPCPPYILFKRPLVAIRNHIIRCEARRRCRKQPREDLSALATTAQQLNPATVYLLRSTCCSTHLSRRPAISSLFVSHIIM